MKITNKYGSEGQYIALGEIYGNTVLETEEGNEVAICMRDDTIEFNVVKFGNWYRINMQTGSVDLVSQGTPLSGSSYEATLEETTAQPTTVINISNVTIN